MIYRIFTASALMAIAASIAFLALVMSGSNFQEPTQKVEFGYPSVTAPAIDGKDGQDGVDGLNGADGLDGVDGKDGRNCLPPTRVVDGVIIEYLPGYKAEIE